MSALLDSAQGSDRQVTAIMRGFRTVFPQYSDMTDEDVIVRMYQRHYSDLTPEDYLSRLTKRFAPLYGLNPRPVNPVLNVLDKVAHASAWTAANLYDLGMDKLPGAIGEAIGPTGFGAAMGALTGLGATSATIGVPAVLARVPETTIMAASGLGGLVGTGVGAIRGSRAIKPDWKAQNPEMTRLHAQMRRENPALYDEIMKEAGQQ